MKMRIAAELFEQLDNANQLIESGNSPYRMSYEEGVKLTLEWVLNITTEKPIDI